MYIELVTSSKQSKQGPRLGQRKHSQLFWFEQLIFICALHFGVTKEICKRKSFEYNFFRAGDWIDGDRSRLFRTFCSIPYAKNTLIISHTYLVVKFSSEKFAGNDSFVARLSPNVDVNEVTISHFQQPRSEWKGRTGSNSLRCGRDNFLGKSGYCWISVKQPEIREENHMKLLFPVRNGLKLSKFVNKLKKNLARTIFLPGVHAPSWVYTEYIFPDRYFTVVVFFQSHSTSNMTKIFVLISHWSIGYIGIKI